MSPHGLSSKTDHGRVHNTDIDRCKLFNLIKYLFDQKQIKNHERETEEIHKHKKLNNIILNKMGFKKVT